MHEPALSDSLTDSLLLQRPGLNPRDSAACTTKACQIVLCALLASLGFLAGGAGAQVITEFSAGISAGAGLEGITAGPDGNLWFTEANIDRIGRITPDGVVTEFSAGISAGAHPTTIAAGPDGNLWFAEPGVKRIGRITPGGVVTEFSAGISAQPNFITAGPDGNLWFMELTPRGSKSTPIGRITPDGVVTEFSVVTNLLVSLGDIAAGPDGNVWFTKHISPFLGGEPHGQIWRISPAGVVTEVGSILGGVGVITTGPDGNVWFTLGAIPRIGRITPQGVMAFFGASPNVRVTGWITAGPDGNLWFTSDVGIGRIFTTAGVATVFTAGFTTGAGVGSIAAGPDGNVWFTEPGINRIGRITACLNEAACSPSTTTLVSSVNPSKLGQALVFTVSVAGNFATGTVQFMDGATNLGSPVSLSGGGVAQLMTSTLTPGAHAITAVYSGDPNNAPSASPVVVQQVGKSKQRRRKG